MAGSAGRELEFGQTAIEGGAAHAEETCGLGAISSGLSEGEHKSAAFIGGDRRGGVRRGIRLLNIGRQVGHLQCVPFAVNHGALNGTLELPYVAGPVIVHQCRHGRCGWSMDRLAHTGTSLRKERGDQERDVLLPLS